MPCRNVVKPHAKEVDSEFPFNEVPITLCLITFAYFTAVKSYHDGILYSRPDTPQLTIYFE